MYIPIILRNTHQKHKSILILIVKISVYVIFLSFYSIANAFSIHNSQFIIALGRARSTQSMLAVSAYYKFAKNVNFV